MDTYKKIVDDAMDYGLEAISFHGSGEPTLSKYFSDAVSYAKSKGLDCYSFTNGYLLDEKISESIVGAGLDVLRVSVIGYDKNSYENWMKIDAFDRVRNNAILFNEISKLFSPLLISKLLAITTFPFRSIISIIPFS